MAGRLDIEWWRGRRVLLTGHTGFKGAWLAAILEGLGAEVTGFALPPDVDRSVFELLDIAGRIQSVYGDLRDDAAVRRVVAEADAEVVLHLAAQAMVPRSIAEPILTFDVNVVGTARLLDASFGQSSTAVVLVVTSDKVYANEETGAAFVEADRLGGGDPYSASKAAAELVAASWRHTYEGPGRPAVVTVRAGNVIGGGDKALTRLLPDVFRAVEAGVPVVLRNPAGVRPWQHVVEPLFGYLGYARAAVQDPALPRSLNFGPTLESCRTVEEVVERVLSLAGGGTWVQEDFSDAVSREATLLRLDASAAGTAIGWHPVLDLETALAWTVEWFRTEQGGGDLLALCAEQVERYLALARTVSTGH